MTTVAARPRAAEPWAEDCRTLAALMEDRGCVLPVVPLGVRDELTAAGPTDGPVAYLYGNHVLLGPFGGRDGRPCARCLARRWQGVRSFSLREALEVGSGTTAAGRSPYVTAFAAELVASVRACAGAEKRATAYLVDLETGLVRGCPVVADPECVHCGRSRPDTADDAVIALRPTPKHEPNGFRLRHIDDYDLPVDAFVNPVCGVVGPSVIYDVASPSTSATIGCFTLRSGEYLRETFWGGHSDSYGRSTRIGILEGLERSAGMRARGKTTQVWASLDEVGADGVDPRTVGLYSEQWYRENPRVVPFATDRVIPWVWGWSMRDRKPVLVPEILTYYHSPGLENRFVQESSNGCASGGCLEEAVYFGLMEVVERDAFLLMWYGQAKLPELDPRTSANPRTRMMVDRLAMYGYEARFFDNRISFPIPVVTGVAVRPDGGLGRMCFGAGASLDPEAALAAAMCEIATDSVNLRGRTARDEPRLRAMVDDFDKVVGLHDHPIVYGIPEMGAHAGFLLDGPRRGPHAMADRYGDVRPVSPDLRDDLEHCVGAVTGAGFDVVVVDQTLPEQRDLGLHTVSVMVPGLLPIDFGWRRQRAPHMPRMRTALREAGLRAHDLRPEDQNPAPHPFP